MGYEIKKIEMAVIDKKIIDQKIQRQEAIGWELISKNLVDTGIMVTVLKFRRDQDTPYHDEMVKIEKKIESSLEERKKIFREELRRNQEKKKLLFLKLILFMLLLLLAIFSLVFAIVFIGAAVTQKNIPFFGLFALFLILSVIFFTFASGFMKRSLPTKSFDGDIRSNFELQEIDDRIEDLCFDAYEIKAKYK